jgi:hypothetical protein
MLLQLEPQSRGGLLGLVLVKKQAHQVPIPVHPRQDIDDAFAVVECLGDWVRKDLSAVSGGSSTVHPSVRKGDHTPLVQDRRRPRRRRLPGRHVPPCLLSPAQLVPLASLRRFLV